jgi:hypothetical protein
VNAHFETLLYGVTGDDARLSDALTHLDQWRAYRAVVETGTPVTNSSRRGGELACVPKDRYSLEVRQAPGGSVVWYPGSPETPFSHLADLRADSPIPVAQRPPTDFLWQAPPTELNGVRDAASREPGIDYLTPYWMLRYYTEVSAPEARPLPPWLGPASR